MSVQELRTKLHASIDAIEDEALLADLQRMLQYRRQAQLVLSAERKAELDAAAAELDAGRSVSNADADRLADQWLSE